MRSISARCASSGTRPKLAAILSAMCAVLAVACCRQLLQWARDPGGPATASFRVTTGAVTLLAFVPALLLAATTATLFSGPDRVWVNALDWLRDETPSPVASPAAFDRTFGRPGDRPFRHVPNAYSVSRSRI